MKFKQLCDELEPKKNKESDKMTLDKFLRLLSPSEREEMKKAESESKKKQKQSD